jgi:urease accessory protein
LSAALIPETTQKSWQGHLQLAFVNQQGRTQLSHQHAQAPLKIQRPFYPEGDAVCHSVMLHTAGGIVGGDRLSFNLHLHPESKALITTAAAGKVYGSSELESQQTTQIRVENNACLEWMPQENILFNGAIFRQNLRVDLAENALWMGWEITRLGRSARGEKFASGIWRSRTEIWQGDRPLWIDPQWIQGGSEMMTSSHGLGGYPVIGSFAVVGRSVSAELVEKARHCWTEGQYQGESGVTRLLSGMLCRYRGHSTSEIRRWFTQVWSFARLELCDRPVCKPRVWQL